MIPVQQKSDNQPSTEKRCADAGKHLTHAGQREYFCIKMFLFCDV